MSRKLTAEEKRVWRESNRFTQRFKPEIDEEIAIADFTPQSPNIKPSVPQAQAPAPLKPLPPLTPVSARETTKLLKQYGPMEATLDLHGMTKLDAYTRVQHFIHHQQAAGRRHIVIITGKGRTSEGVLRTNLPHWLNDASLRPAILAMAYAKPEKGGTGVMHVILRRKR